MLYVVLCTDKPNSLEVRLKLRPDHVSYLTSLQHRMKTAGPFLDKAGDPCGSLVVLEADSMAEAEAMAAKDPYAQAGLFASVDIKPWKWTLKNPETV